MKYLLLLSDCRGGRKKSESGKNNNSILIIINCGIAQCSTANKNGKKYAFIKEKL